MLLPSAVFLMSKLPHRQMQPPASHHRTDGFKVSTVSNEIAETNSPNEEVN